LGACSATTEKDAGYLFDNNTRYTIRLFEAAREKGIRFIYASSAATYGDGSKGFDDDEDRLEELEPLNMYGYSKHMFDLWLKRNGLLKEAVGLKYFNVFGPFEAHKGRMSSAVFHMVPQVRKEGKVRLFMSSEPETYADGGQMRDFVYGPDAAKMTLAFLENKTGGIFNVATGNPTTWNTLATAVFEAIGQKPNIEYIPMPEDLIGKYQNYTCANMKKTKAVLGEKAETTPIGQAVKEYVKELW
ncbi:MAG: ADP-glyceromanno-heptose 6-epimerase, partial [Chlamydiia bacterium]|nr:ADP-glyceromanno-heptose 6-epimerase [Chlamydiia bacterium]